MEIEDRIAEAARDEPAVYYIERRRLLGNEEHRLSLAQALRDHVGNRLALPRSRRSDEDKVASLRRSKNRRELRAVGREWCQQVTWRPAAINLPRRDRWVVPGLPIRLL